MRLGCRLAASMIGALLLVATADAQDLASTRIDGLAAIVGDGPRQSRAVILRSDVELRARLALLPEDPARALDAVLPAGLLTASLSELIGETLIAREAERVQIATPTPAEVSREKQRMTLGAPGALQALLRRMGASERELDVIAQRRATVAAFLRANLEGAMIVSAGEIEERLRDPGAILPGEDAQAAQMRLRNALAKEALQRNIERWVRVLQARVPVRVFAKYEVS